MKNLEKKEGDVMSLYSKLYDWQKPNVDFAATKSSYGLFLEMGL